MRKIVGLMAVGLAIGMLSSNMAFAQGRRGGRGFGGGGGFQFGPTQLLRAEKVQKELSLTDDQKTKIKEILDQQQGGRRGGGGGGQNFQDMTEEQRNEFFAEMRKRNEETTKKAVAELNDDQNMRLKQIQLWVNPATTSLSQNQDVEKELSLTDEQKSAVKTISEESGKKNQEIFGKMRGANPDEQAKLREEATQLRKDTDAEALAVLTPDQVAKFDKLKGPKFEIDPSELFGGFGRGGRGGRRGGNNN